MRSVFLSASSGTGDRMKIELLKPEDLQSYKELIDECFGQSNSLDEYKKYSKNSENSENSENAARRIYVVKDRNSGEVVGSATQYAIELFTFGFQPSIMIFNVAVRNSHRGQKIAKRLLEHMIENARSEGFRSVSLTCLGSAYPAHRLYESLGFGKTDSVKYHIDL